MTAGTAAPGDTAVPGPTMTGAPTPTTTTDPGGGDGGGAPGVEPEPEPEVMEPEPMCGDGTVDAILGEQCDDMNTADGDGCSSTCQTEAGDDCGNGMVEGDEECDDGNTMDGDGCEANCTLPPEEAVCGNGTPEIGEECDDGNMDPDDGCEPDCTMTPEVEGPVCGDGNVDEGELCDDGNMDPGDGCEPDCTETVVELSLAELVGDLDGRLLTTPCADQPGTDDCGGAGWIVNGGNTNPCQGGSLDARTEHAIGGTPGATYNIAMHHYGVMEPKNYGGQVDREAAPGGPNRDEGGTPTAYATASAGHTYPGSNYNTYEVHVDNEMMQEVGVYYFNADTGEGHYTFGINYEKTIPIIGGGRIRLRTFDANCRQIKNCGNGGTPCAGKARTIDISGADPQPQAGWLEQPGLGQPAEHSGQWWLIDITSFEEAQ